ncbi:MAG: efflux RND transporter permease subunit [Pseudomonadota bacterium]
MSQPTGIEALGQRIASWSIRARWGVIALSVLVCIGISSGAANLKFAGDYRVFFGPENPEFLASQRAEATFGRSDSVGFLVLPRSGDVFTGETLEAVAALTDASWRLPFVSRVDSLTNFQHTYGLEGELVVEDLVLDPSALDAAALEGIKTIAQSEPLIDGFVVSRDGSATVVNAVVQAPTDQPTIASTIADAARDIRDQVELAHPGVEIELIGVQMLSATFEEAGLQDSQTLIPLVYLLILVVMFVMLRSVTATFTSLLLILLATLFGMGIAGFLGIALTPISLSAPTIILTIAVADAVHVFAIVREKMRDGMAKREALIASVALNFSPIALTSITTIVGFLTLNFSDSPPFHHLGNITAAGIFAAWILSVTFLPAVASLLPLSFKAPPEGRTPVMERVANTVIARPGQIAAGMVLTGAALIAAIPTMTINDQWTQYFGERLEFRQAVDRANPVFGTDQLNFVLDPGEPGAVTDPAFLGFVDEFTAYLRSKDERIAHVYSLSDIMKRINFNLNADDPAYFAIPQDRRLAGQYLFVYELSLPYGLDLNDRVDIDRQTTRVTASTWDISTVETRALIDEAEAWVAANANGVATLEVTGSKRLFAFVADRNIEAMFAGAGYLIVAIFVILAVAFRSIGVGALSLVANALPILATFGFWALTVGVVGFSVAAVGAVAVGLVVDFTVHFLAKYLRARDVGEASTEEAIRYAFRTAGSAIFVTTVILAAGFALLATSTFKLNADLGLMTAAAIVFAMLVNLLLLPALILLQNRRRAPAAAIPA